MEVSGLEIAAQSTGGWLSITEEDGVYHEATVDRGIMYTEQRGGSTVMHMEGAPLSMEGYADASLGDDPGTRAAAASRYSGFG